MGSLRRLLVGFGKGVWEFLVGDTPEVLVLTVLVLGLTFATRSVQALAIVLLPVAVVASLAGSVRWGRVRSRRDD